MAERLNGEPADDPDGDVALDTYRFLRGGLVVMVVMLAGSLLVERSHATCWQTSISAYYFTTAHAIFIGALFAIGAMLIVYQGTSDTENTLLNLAGVLTFVIATVPTTRPVLLCNADDPTVSTSSTAILLNIWTVAVTLALSRVASWWLFGRGRTPRRDRLATAAIWLQRIILGVGVVVLVAAPDWFRANGHGIAATVMFAAIVLTVVNTAFGTRPTCGPHYRRIYQAISIIMAVTLVTTVVLHQVLDGFNHAVLVVEVALIVEFAAYWVVQTIQDDHCTR
ncbi:hypothetical protein [Mycobacterium sp. OTB74]|jgi:hypothetical protein|uniref:hypothetical protein n=1 Tax=Mycobacterium sp. OTB74 TaxID=1853452 RepID=UPI002474D5F1|nr:hypothetical protein [Mycobacterium sp. OTB74]MDH6243353.1 hypothetical protein [Mycobacterium sp. OTB74]